MLLPFIFTHNKQPKQTLRYLQLVMIFMYFWSGVQKLNPNFPETTFAAILEHLFSIKDAELRASVQSLGYAVPIIEIATSILLIIPRTRNAGVWIAASTHLLILLYLSPLGVNDNTIVYPWNIALIASVVLLFYGTNNSILTIEKPLKPIAFLTIFMVLLLGIMPLLNFVKAWDDYLSFSLYSDKTHRFYIAIQEDEVSKLDHRYQPYFVQIEGMQGGEMIDVNEWSMEELNVPFYPETRLFKKLSRSFCTLGIPDEKIIFIEYERPVRNNVFSSFGCVDK